MLASGELETGIGANQICTLSRPRAIRWSSHYSSVNRLIDMFGATCTVLENTMKNGLSNNVRGETKEAFQALRSFEFGWDSFLCTVLTFCGGHEIDMSDMSARYMEGARHSCQQQNDIAVEHYYHFNIFNAVIDFQLMELGTRFPDQTMELFTLSSALDPTNNFEINKVYFVCS
ncbi:hypothetical protein ACOSP7_028434 [Xanthoceras sorbifolium]